MTDARVMRARYRRILRFAGAYLVQTWWFELFLPRFGLAAIGNANRERRLRRLAQRFRGLAVDLGGLMIKVGQFLSARLDVLPPEITKELEGLQDEVPAVPFGPIAALAEAQLGVPLAVAYEWIDPVPVAAASLGQAHRARLSTSDAEAVGYTDVVVKVQRPGIDEIVDVDLAALRRVAGWLSHIRIVSDRADAPALIEEFATVSLEEIDYLHEAANGERFAADTADDPRVRTPQVVWERTTRKVLTLEDVSAIKIADVEGLRAAGIDPHDVALEFAGTMFDQLFLRGYFHADPHPGNLFVQPTPGGPRPWVITYVDFGMMGQVPDTLRRGLIRVMVAAAARDGKGLVNGIREVGVLLPSADTIQLERAMTKLFDRFGGMGFAELQQVDPREFRAFAIEFGDVVRSLPFQFPENFLLVIRAMSLTSGMASNLDPKFNIWDAIEPYAQHLVRAEGGNVGQEFVRRFTSAAGLAARLPGRLDELVTRVEDGRVVAQVPAVERRLARVEGLLRRVLSAVLFAALFLGGVLLRSTDAVFGTVVLIVSALPLLYALFAGAVGRRGP